jgi:16S rRNA (uracil1498-N3)-methyltransferase
MSQPETRLYVEQNFIVGAHLTLSAPQAHQLRVVQRLEDGAIIALFNGRDGEYTARLSFSRRSVEAEILMQRRRQTASADLWLLFAPIKHGRIDFLVEKASELGAGMLQPVITRRTQVARVNTARLQENAREAAEQCERLTVPVVNEPVALEAALQNWEQGRVLFACLETGASAPLATAAAAHPSPKAAILIGPEGGFAPEELDLLAAQDFVVPVGLGPRLLRAETAAIAALSLWQGVAGEWADAANRPHADLL